MAAQIPIKMVSNSIALEKVRKTRAKVKNGHDGVGGIRLIRNHMSEFNKRMPTLTRCRLPVMMFP
jgi:hypothetical protein